MINAAFNPVLAMMSGSAIRAARVSASVDALIAARPQQPVRAEPATRWVAKPAVQFNDDDWYEYEPQTLRILAQYHRSTFRAPAVFGAEQRGYRDGVLVRGMRAKYLGLLHKVTV